MNFRNVLRGALCASVLVIELTGCPNPIPISRGGTLSIQLTNNINARTLLPLLDMAAVSYTVSGTGPGGAAFSQSTSGGAVQVNGLAFGGWSVTANALNADGAVIGRGQAAVTIQTGQTATLTISVVPLAGNGTLSLSVTWPESQVDDPSILATLTPPSGPETHLSFSVSGGQGTFSSTTIPAGYQTLTLQLRDNDIAVMGAVEVVRIVAGQMTTGSYAFSNLNQPGGAVQVNVTPAMADPIPVSISGMSGKATAGTGITGSASADDGTGNVVYVWYLNGVSVGQGPTFSSNPLAAGFYRLDVTAYSADGTRAGSASVSFQAVTLAVIHPAYRSYVYVTNYLDQSVAGYEIASGGSLTPLSPPSFAAGSGPRGIAVTRNGSLLYVANGNSNSVSAYAVGVDGVLTPLSTPSFAAGASPWGIAATPNGSFLYTAAEHSNAVSAYAIGPGGVLTPLSPPAFATGLSPHGIAVTPNGSFLYVTNKGEWTVSGYAIGPDGTLTPLSTPAFATGSSPEGIVVTPNGSFLYVTAPGFGSNAVWAYSIGADGLLTPLGTPSFPSENPYGMAVTTDSSLLYVANYGIRQVSVYAIGSDGLLTPLGSVSSAAGFYPNGLAVAPDNSSLYVTYPSSNSVSAYAIGSDGLLTPVAGPAAETGIEPFSIVAVQRSPK